MQNVVQGNHQKLFSHSERRMILAHRGGGLTADLFMNRLRANKPSGHEGRQGEGSGPSWERCEHHRQGLQEALIITCTLCTTALTPLKNKINQTGFLHMANRKRGGGSDILTDDFGCSDTMNAKKQPQTLHQSDGFCFFPNPEILWCLLCLHCNF